VTIQVGGPSLRVPQEQDQPPLCVS
jgi:hypothetical protein